MGDGTGMRITRDLIPDHHFTLNSRLSQPLGYYQIRLIFLICQSTLFTMDTISSLILVGDGYRLNGIKIDLKY